MQPLLLAQLWAWDVPLQKLFAEHGAKVVVADFNSEAGNEVVEFIKSKGGTAALKPNNNSFQDLDEDYWNRLQAVDLKGTALSMKYEIRQFMAQGGGGSIINISSINAFKPTTGNPAYQAFIQ